MFTGVSKKEATKAYRCMRYLRKRKLRLQGFQRSCTVPFLVDTLTGSTRGARKMERFQCSKVFVDGVADIIQSSLNIKVQARETMHARGRA